jgi:hypothetical protein
MILLTLKDLVPITTIFKVTNDTIIIVSYELGNEMKL